MSKPYVRSLITSSSQIRLLLAYAQLSLVGCCHGSLQKQDHALDRADADDPRPQLKAILRL